MQKIRGLSFCIKKLYKITESQTYDVRLTYGAQDLA